MEKEKQYVSYSEAVKDLDLVLCNNIIEYHELSDYTFRLEDYIDDEVIKEVDEEGCYTTDEEREQAIRDKAYEKFYEYLEIYQYFLTDVYPADVEYYVKKYGLIFAYCDDLDIYVLLVNHLGTSWDCRKVEVK